MFGRNAMVALNPLEGRRRTKLNEQETRIGGQLCADFALEDFRVNQQATRLTEYSPSQPAPFFEVGIDATEVRGVAPAMEAASHVDFLSLIDNNAFDGVCAEL